MNMYVCNYKYYFSDDAYIRSVINVMCGVTYVVNATVATTLFVSTCEQKHTYSLN
jgi:hypothetical protein